MYQYLRILFNVYKILSTGYFSAHPRDRQLCECFSQVYQGADARLTPVISGPVANLELKGRASRVVVLRLYAFIAYKPG